jgi:glutathione S-transferase fosA5
MITGLNHLTLSTKDLEPSFTFYRDVLGLRPLLRHLRGAYLLAGDFWLCLDLDPLTRSGPLPEYTHLAWTVGPNDFSALSEKIKSSGARIWKENKSEGNSLYFLDPDGHKLEIHVGNWRARLRDAARTRWGESMEFFESPSSTILRRAEAHEADLLTALAFRSKAFWPHPLDYLLKCAEALRFSSEDLSGWPVYAAEASKEIVGFFALKEISGEPRLDHLWIDPRFIGKGIGRALFLKAVEEAQKLNWQKFRIVADPYALDFYLKLGAKQIGKSQSIIKPDLFLPYLEFDLLT